jgi:fumarate hydratase subunit alpha
MKKISPQTIISALKPAIISACTELNENMLKHLKEAGINENSERGQYVISEILDNAEIASDESMPLCQDTGVSIFFVKWGQECVLEGMSLQETLDEAVRRAYSEGYLRKSILRDPIFDRSNTGDNTPAVIHLESVPGDQVEISFLPKGAGADNCSRVAMLNPSDGLEGIKAFIMDVCKKAGASSCPPWVLGVGIGGTFDSVAGLAKHAILRPVGSHHEDENYKKLEEELFQEVNQLGIGPQGLGGIVTALALHIEARPCHAASLPVAVNIQCHSNRRALVKV